MQMLQSWSKGNMKGEIELYSSRSLQNPGCMALALLALEKQSLTENLTEKLTSQETLKHMSILFIKGMINLYFSKRMSNPNFMALALTVPKKHC